MIGLYYKANDCRSENCIEILKKSLSDNSLAYKVICEGSPDSGNDDIDVMIVFGGDGTVLRASKIAGSKIPIVGINTGSLGFLSSYESDDVFTLVEDILSGTLTFSERRFMSVKVNDKEFFALNDAVITKNHLVDNVSECIKLYLKIDGQFVDAYVGDGLILSTPTGSTAYAISAGGPIMVPDVNAYVVAPICAHTLHSKPIVYPQKSLAEVKVLSNSKECALFIDGKMEACLKPETIVKITASDSFARICNKSDKFFSRLSEKLNKWSNIDLLEV